MLLRGTHSHHQRPQCHQGRGVRLVLLPDVQSHRRGKWLPAPPLLSILTGDSAAVPELGSRKALKYGVRQGGGRLVEALAEIRGKLEKLYNQLPTLWIHGRLCLRGGV